MLRSVQRLSCNTLSSPSFGEKGSCHLYELINIYICNISFSFSVEVGIVRLDVWTSRLSSLVQIFCCAILNWFFRCMDFAQAIEQASRPSANIC